MSGRGDLMYRCRACSAEFVGVDVPDLPDAIGSLVAIGRHGELSLRTTHRCDDGRIGVADLIGADPTPATAD